LRLPPKEERVRVVRETVGCLREPEVHVGVRLVRREVLLGGLEAVPFPFERSDPTGTARRLDRDGAGARSDLGDVVGRSRVEFGEQDGSDLRLGRPGLRVVGERHARHTGTQPCWSLIQV
jgi:hypothetical protein